METNIIYCGDNLEVLPKYIPAESVDLIYIDPPFNSSRNYEVFWGEAQEKRSFIDRFGDAMSYLDWMRPRIRELYRVLKPTGSFYYHCDWHASHYVKVELDRIFAFNNLRNEVIWSYKRYTADSKKFQRLHDTIFFYGKTEDVTFNDLRIDYGEKSGKADSHYKKDEEGRWYRWQKRKDEEPYKVYLSEGRRLGDVWELPIINASAKERLGYPTQKPLALLDRIIRASSDEGQVVLDAFCGCGTTLEAAAANKRKWIGIDFSPTACRVMVDRLERRLGLKDGIDFQLRDMPKTAEQLRHMPAFEFENWAIVALGGIPNKVKVGDYGIDGRLYLADMVREHRGDFAEMMDVWYPIQVKQQDKAGRPDIDKFQTAMRRDKRVKGYFIAFGFSQDAIHEIKRANKSDGLDITPITVDEILSHERTTL